MSYYFHYIWNIWTLLRYKLFFICNITYFHNWSFIFEILFKLIFFYFLPSFFFYCFITFLFIFYSTSKIHDSSLPKKIFSFYGYVDSFPSVILKNSKFKDCRVYYKNPHLEETYRIQTSKIKILFNNQKIWIKKKFYILIKSRFIKNFQKGTFLYIQNPAYRIKLKYSSCGGSNFNYSFYLKSHSLDYTSYIYKKAFISKIHGPSFYYGMIESIRSFLKNIYKKNLNPTEFSIILALVLGDKSKIPSSIHDSFIHSGISHILAISGLHIGMISIFIFFVFSLFKIKKKITFIFISIFLLFYIQLIGWKIPIIRATFFFIYYTLCLLMYREFSFFNCLCLSSIFILILSPFSLYQADFQFSFLASFSIFFYFPIFHSKISFLLKKLFFYFSIHKKHKKALFYKILLIPINIFLITLSSQILLLPILLFHFQGFSLISLLSNIPILFFIQGILSLSILFPFLSIFPNFILLIYSHILSILIQLTIQISFYFSSLSYSYFQLYITKYLVILYYILQILIIIKYYPFRKRIFIKKF